MIFLPGEVKPVEVDRAGIAAFFLSFTHSPAPATSSPGRHKGQNLNFLLPANKEGAFNSPGAGRK